MMDIRNRFRFARCSQGCWNLWARITKNEPCSIIFRAREEEVALTIRHEEEWRPEEESGFNLYFTKLRDDNQVIRYDNLDCDELWSIEVDSSFDVIQIGAEHVKRALQFYQSSIKTFIMDVSPQRDWLSIADVSIENLRSTESLIIQGDVENMRSLLPKVRHPLKRLHFIEEEEDDAIHENFEQIFQVREELYWPATFCTYEEFLQISAKYVDIGIGNLTEQNICHFINSWKNGEYVGQIEECTWYFRNSRFDKQLLCQLLGVDPSLIDTGIVIDRADCSRRAVLRDYRYDRLVFTTFYEQWLKDNDEHVDLFEEEDDDDDESGSDFDFEAAVENFLLENREFIGDEEDNSD